MDVKSSMTWIEIRLEVSGNAGVDLKFGGGASYGQASLCRLGRVDGAWSGSWRVVESMAGFVAVALVGHVVRV